MRCYLRASISGVLRDQEPILSVTLLKEHTRRLLPFVRVRVLQGSGLESR